MYVNGEWQSAASGKTFAKERPRFLFMGTGTNKTYVVPAGNRAAT